MANPRSASTLEAVSVHLFAIGKAHHFAKIRSVGLFFEAELQITTNATIRLKASELFLQS